MADTENKVSGREVNGYLGTPYPVKAAEPLAIYDLVYMSISGAKKALGDAEDTMPVLGMCVETGIGDRPILFEGIITNVGWNWDTSKLIYASQTIPGGMTQDLDSFTLGQVMQWVATPITSITIRLHPHSYVTVGV